MISQSGNGGPAGEWNLPDELREMARSGDADVVREVLSVFQTDTAQRLMVLRAAVSAGNAAQVKSQAHAIKGSASQIGANGVAALCRRIETEAAEIGSAGLTQLVGQLETGFDEVSRAISAKADWD